VTGATQPLRDLQVPYTEVTQTILHGTIEGVGGNCFQAAIASVLNMPIEAVPHFVQFTWWPMALELWARGLAPKGLTYKEKYEDGVTVPDDLCIVYGPSPRGVDHCVVGFGGEIVWDPHPSRAGLLSIKGYGWFEEWEHNDTSCWACKRPYDDEGGIQEGAE
jgi:hypothetical protein